MGEAENQDSMQLSEELQFVTACLIGHYVLIQTTSFLFHGMLQAANFDKDYGVVLTVAGEELDHGNIKIFLRDIVYIAAESGEDTEATEQHATSFASGTNIVADQKLCHPSGENTNTTVLNATSVASSTITGIDQMGSYTYPLNSNSQGSYTYPLNSNSQPMMPIMQPAQIDNSFQGVQINSQPIPMSVSYQPPNNYGVQWHYPNAGGQFVAYVRPPYPQASRPIQGYVPHQVQGYDNQPQYPPGSQNFGSSYQAPRGY